MVFVTICLSALQISVNALLCREGTSSYPYSRQLQISRSHYTSSKSRLLRDNSLGVFHVAVQLASAFNPNCQGSLHSKQVGKTEIVPLSGKKKAQLFDIQKKNRGKFFFFNKILASIYFWVAFWLLIVFYSLS